MSTTGTALHLDELRELAVRDPAELTPGAEVIFAHLPELGSSRFGGPFRDSVSAHSGTIIEVSPKHHHELGANRRELPGSEAELAIVYLRQDTGEQAYRYAVDSGVTPYGAPGREFYNPVNFTVLLAPLEAQGIVPLLTASPEFTERLHRYSSQIDFLATGFGADGGYQSHRAFEWGLVATADRLTRTPPIFATVPLEEKLSPEELIEQLRSEGVLGYPPAAPLTIRSTPRPPATAP